MSYDKCPQCGDDRAVRRDGVIVECRSCKTPFSEDWLTDNWTVYPDYETANNS